ncbi:peptide-methionine (S)-S-oxide reductase MsrA [Halobacteriovorax sp. HLS]|uniref:peptide-methionine (S)-S-oxide reductase MsrA n=1 Tax=Halobacteriovorax sp. HLS TaxID=2234000 RepID=UPI001F4DFA67|nr:peptide-methionine (S)-S-oxide reductase MsrA [Halobacteriovorax sp. HLS]
MKKALYCTILFILFGGVVMAKENIKQATFAGGCFWCMEPPFDKLKGVKSTISGYAGGHDLNPTYEEVSAGKTGHTEVIQITYDENLVSYETLLDTFWKNIDPTDAHGQFVDKGSQYRPAIFFHDETQKEAALKSKSDLEKSGRFSSKIVVEVTKLDKFFPAEEYHQDFYQKSPVRYKFYRYNSGRDQFLKKVWDK